MHDTGEMPASFADIAVAMSLALAKLRLDMTQTEIIAGRITMSPMGLEVTLAGLRRDIALVEEGLELLKSMIDIEPQVRAAIARKGTGQWLPRLARIAAL